jgi:hypothetical protein
LYAYGTHKDTEVRADCSGATCVGNEHVIGQAGSPIVGPVVGPGAGRPVPIGENWYTDIGGLFGGTPEQFMEDAGFVKLREISVAYTFDEPWAQPPHMDQLHRLRSGNESRWVGHRDARQGLFQHATDALVRLLADLEPLTPGRVTLCAD